MNRISVGLLTLLVAALPASSAHAVQRDLERLTIGGNEAASNFVAISDDGRVGIIETSRALSPTDTDSRFDVYTLVDGVVTLVSDGTSGADAEIDANFNAMSADGSHVVVRTAEALVPADTDSSLDVYDATGGTVVLASDRVQPGADAASEAFFDAISADGSRLVFHANTEPLVAEDGDSSPDVYLRAGGQTKLLSDRVQGGTDAAIGAQFKAASDDVRRVVIATTEPLMASDGDASTDLYETSDLAGGAVTLEHASDRVQSSADAAAHVTDAVVSADGSTVAFRTAEPLVSTDGDASLDVYTYRGGAVTLVSDRRRAGVDQEENASEPLLSPDGSGIFFETEERLVAEDEDDSLDVYANLAGTVRVLSDDAPANPDPNTDVDLEAAEDTTAIVRTREALAPGDTDTSEDDIYRVSAGDPVLLSDAAGTAADGNEPVFFSFAGGGRVVFHTVERLLLTDGDTRDDVYEHDGTGLVQVSKRTAPGPDAETDAAMRAGTPDAQVILFATTEPLVASDSDNAEDLYRSAPAPPPTPPADPPAGGGGDEAPPPAAGGGDPPTQPAPPAAPQPPGAPAPLLDRLAPVLARLSVPKKITAGKQGAVSFRLNEAARVTLTFKRRASKRKLVGAGTTTVNARAGATKVKTSKKLKPGAYEVTVVAVDTAGNRSAARKAKFTVVKPKRRKKS